MTDVAQFLREFGGWGVCAILLFGIRCIYVNFSELLEKRNDRLMEVLKESTAVLQQNANGSIRIEAALQRVECVLSNIDPVSHRRGVDFVKNDNK